ncbi:DMT family transporter [Leptolyngbya iicbica]|uniref:EamA family transporter n=2 Tax=Cyanophyceae TaxID=3028117 RepID=A0A4Q7E932_9CYAN|nr:DMT family transporter [Leptolyngbya sp. LK]RZM77371.1 EamA family transporter [Leptolyngbya sp. LK]
MDRQRQGFLVSGRVYLIIAVLIFGAANAVTRQLTDLGAAHFVDGHNPVSACNVLFVGNVCALGLLGMLYHRQLRPGVLRQMAGRQWAILTLIAIVGGALVPMLIFTALSITAVNNVVLISQLSAPLALALSAVFLGARVNVAVALGAIVAFVGVALTVLLPTASPDSVETTMGLTIGKGDLLVLVAAVLQAIANLISKISLQTVPLGFFNVYRTLVGTVFFFVATIVLFEPSHFMDVTSPFLWQWMLLYSAVIVVGGQLAWFAGLKKSTASEISLATAFTPIAGVLAAYLILGEVPTVAQYVGGAVIVVGIVLNQIGVQQLNRATPLPKPPTPAAMNDKVLYKGV